MGYERGYLAIVDECSCFRDLTKATIDP
ncbi:uncharacterized protein G2W53_011066 [Senna tora]|uniref:Uncharacterized protein n=1 Tax=Senna tora TaxID=362788 RepID=A0A835CES8_9FABA|nr:uncharacterized protein G2W53_011066 [Senna tora]